MFEVDPQRNRIEVSGDSVRALDFVAEEVCHDMTEDETPYLLELIAARGEAAREIDYPEVRLSVEATQFIHKQAERLLQEDNNRGTPLKQRIRQKISGRLGMLAYVRDETAAVLETAQGPLSSDSDTSTLDTQSAASSTAQPELPSALDPMSVAMRDQAARQTRRAEAMSGGGAGYPTRDSSEEGPAGDVMAELGIY